MDLESRKEAFTCPLAHFMQIRILKVFQKISDSNTQSQKTFPAHRLGNKHMVSVDDLVLFVKSDGRLIPQIPLEQVGGI